MGHRVVTPSSFAKVEEVAIFVSQHKPFGIGFGVGELEILVVGIESLGV